MWVALARHHERRRCPLRWLDSEQLLANQFEFFHAVEDVLVELRASR